MRVSSGVLVVALVLLSNICLSSFAVAQSEQVVAEHVLGPQWKRLSRRAGMIFAGTVLATASPTATNQTVTPPAVMDQTVTTQTAAAARPIPGMTSAVQLSFRVDEAIAGVERGQILTIHEWTGAWSMQRSMSPGQHILIFLYPLSRLGLTSPVGGSLGQIFLDSRGKNMADGAQRPAPAVGSGSRNASSPRPAGTVASGTVSVLQLERAIRRARSEKE